MSNWTSKIWDDYGDSSNSNTFEVLLSDQLLQLDHPLCFVYYWALLKINITSKKNYLLRMAWLQSSAEQVLYIHDSG